MAVGKKSTHKNAARSRHLIKQAFAELLNEKDMAKITVTDIVERANISRGTFYAHYLDVYDLYSAIQSNIVEAVDETIDKLGIDSIILDPTEVFTTSLKFLDKNKSYYKLFLTSSYGEQLIRRIMSLAEEKFYHEISSLFEGEEITEHTCHMYYTLGGIRNILIHWFTGNMGLDAEKCAEYLVKFYFVNKSEALCEAVRAKQAKEKTE